MNKTVYTEDTGNKKMIVTRTFDAPIEHVWQAWTDSDILDQWWAPKPWKANTKTMDFSDGGFWLYNMEGPKGEIHWSRADYKNIVQLKSFEASDYFCDEQGNKNTSFPGSHWHNEFSTAPDGTKVEIAITFASEADLKAMVEMGFKEGFEAAHGNLDELLTKK